jgi:hypothetical protein
MQALLTDYVLGYQLGGQLLNDKSLYREMVGDDELLS